MTELNGKSLLERVEDTHQKIAEAFTCATAGYGARMEMLPTFLMAADSSAARVSPTSSQYVIVVKGEERHLCSWGSLFFKTVNAAARLADSVPPPQEHAQVIFLARRAQAVARKGCADAPEEELAGCVERATPVAAGIMIDEKKCGDFGAKMNDEAFGRCVVDAVRFYLGLADAVTALRREECPAPTPRRDDDRR